MKINPYNLSKAPRPRVDFVGARGKSLTQQHFKSDCDINAMIRRALTGDGSALRKGVYGDFRNLPESLHDAQNRMAFANSMWNDLPDNVRATVGSPEALLKQIDAKLASDLKKTDVKPSPKENEKETVTEVNPSASPSMDAAHADNT